MARRSHAKGLVGLNALFGLALGACSTAAPPPPTQECFVDDECAAGELCLLDQGGICQSLGTPARRVVLGMDVTEGDFRIELRGCDAEIDPIDGVLRSDPRERMSSLAQIAAHAERPTVGCADCSATDTCEPGGDRCRAPFDGTFSLRRASRLGLSSVRREGLAYPLLDEMMLPTEGTVDIDWARLSSSDEDADAPAILELTPSTPSLARMRFEIARATDNSPREFEAVSRLDCQRRISGRVRRVGGSDALEGATVAMSFDEPIAPISTVLGATADQLPACSEDEDCSSGRACNVDAGRCGLDLQSSEAARDVLTDEFGAFTSPIYTYCEDGEVDTRRLIVELRPAEDSGLPRMSYPVEQAFALPLLGTPVAPDPLEADLCVPNWPAPKELDLAFSGTPFKLLSNDEGEYVCCSSECLPTVQDPREPSTAQDCAETTLNVVAATSFILEDTQPWIDDACLEPASGESGSAEYNTSCEAGVCAMRLSSGESVEGQSYTLKIESPPGSVFRSEVRTLTVAPETTELAPVQLQPRVVVSGRVRCAESLGETCVPEDVAVVAERIRMPGEDPDTPPPFFYDTTTVADGSYILLVDPGVYLLTAMPPNSSGAGPGEFRVLDLRIGTADSVVNVVDDVPTASAPVMEIEAGVPVVLRLRDFSTAARVRPLDRGSWTAQGGVSDPDGRVLDLNDPLTCYGEGAVDRGCEIRSLLRPRSGALVTSISNAADFTMRFEGGIECPVPGG